MKQEQEVILEIQRTKGESWKYDSINEKLNKRQEGKVK